jgi:hypothetical protein
MSNIIKKTRDELEVGDIIVHLEHSYAGITYPTTYHRIMRFNKQSFSGRQCNQNGVLNKADKSLSTFANYINEWTVVAK